MIKKYDKGCPVYVSDDFVSTEFDCRCTHHDCTFTLIDDDEVARLQALRERVKRAVHIDSAYRCPQHQKDLARQGLETARGVSQHELGRAQDIWVSGMNGTDLSTHAKSVGWICIGVAGSWIHVDGRMDQGRIWFYRSAKNARDYSSVP